MITRNMEKDINHWLSDGRDAFLITGARQTGKTYLIRACLKKSGLPYEEFNFIERPELVNLFASAKSSEQLLLRISAASSRPLEPGRTVIFFDEIQECKDIVTAIKFLVEDASYRYILSGSLLGIELNDIRSAPVGYMRIKDMYPLTLGEFFRAVGINEDTLGYVNSCYVDVKEVDSFIHEKLMDVFYLYLITGGMPEAVDVYLDTNDIARVSAVHEKIVRLYKQDFSKYESRNNKLILHEIYDAIPGELEEKNKRFFINRIGENYDRVKNNFLWLKDAGVAIPIYNVTEPKAPLKISEKRSLFKLFMSDVGLLTSLYSASVKFSILERSGSINQGGLFENVIAQELHAKNIKTYYFNSKRQGELDFVTEIGNEILPLEIKSGKDYMRHSALNNVLNNEDYGIKKAFVLHNGNVRVKGRVVYLPIYMAAFIEEESRNNLIYKIDLSGV